MMTWTSNLAWTAAAEASAFIPAPPLQATHGETP